LSTVFVVSGRGFSPNSKVELRIVDGHLQHPVAWVETAEADGTLTSRRSYPCVTGESLTVSAFETRQPQGHRVELLRDQLSIIASSCARVDAKSLAGRYQWR
jgi:hypothetical protein